MFSVKSTLFFVFVLLALTLRPAFAERPLEDASYSEGMKAITEMHVLNSLGLTGELIGIYRALNQASYAAAILHGRKWIPGEDDLSWVDDPNYGKIRHDPLAGLRPDDKRIVKKRLGNIQYLNELFESGEYTNSDEKNEILQGINEQIKALKRTLSSYPDFYAKAFPKNSGGNSDPRTSGCAGILGSYDFGNWAGALQLWQEGGGVKGTYGKTGKNSVTGTLTGNVLTGNYTNKEAKREGTFKLAFTLQSDGTRTVTGTWRQTSPSVSDGSWGIGKQRCP